MKAKIENNYITIISIFITVFAGIAALLFIKESFLIIKENVVILLIISIVIFQFFILTVKVDSLKRKEAKGIKLIQSLTCYNQSSYLDFSVISREYHKNIKNELVRQKTDEGELKSAFVNFSGYISSSLYKILMHNIEFIEKYFSQKKGQKTLPRISVRTLKGHQLVGVSTTNTHLSESSNVLELNTGLNYVTEHGTYYLCQDIPNASKSGEYVNPLLNREAAIKYKPGFLSSFFTAGRYDKRWCECWEGKYCYKSTLIIPITLMNNNMSDQFRNHFLIKDVSRSIWGFICLDHPETGYFDDDDVSMGYIFADVISLYLVTSFLLTEGSQTYQKTKKILNIGNEESQKIISLDLFSPTRRFT